MYISEINIKGYRNFENQNIHFNPGLNILIGHNNSGKTNLISGLQLLFNRNEIKKPCSDDFCKLLKDYSAPPKIEISVTIEEFNDKGDDKNVVYDWLIQDSPTYKAQLTYIFELPSKHHNEYNKLIEECKDEGGNFKQEQCIQLLEKKFIAKYISKIYGGNPAKQEKVDTENLDRFDFQFLDAIRDAERQMFFGNNTLLRDVLNYFLDYDISQGKGFDELTKEQLAELKKREDEFREMSNSLLSSLINRIDKEEILRYSEDTGADNGGTPNLDADISEQELLFALRLIVEKSGFKIPIKYNGLGYNNLLYIALILSKMQMESSSFMGDNAKVFPVLAIEEPEAHLHPSLQTKFLKFLDKNLNSQQQARQVFITSHSTHITSAVDLDAIICLYEDYKKKVRIGYPSKVFGNDAEDNSSKLYVRRFLDATKSNMLFADRLIFVEGLSEQLLIPCFAEYLNKETELIDKHTSIISVDSRTFKHFLKIFAFDEQENPFAINKKIVCITDTDPIKKKGNRWKATFPYCLDDTENSKSVSSHIETLHTVFDKYENIDIYHPIPGLGKTLEYDLALVNPTTTLLITDSFPSQNSAHTKENYSEIIEAYDEGIDRMTAIYQEKLGVDEIQENTILRTITESNWDEPEKKGALIASIYYTIISSTKGEHAFYLEKQLRENLVKDEEEQDNFTLPQYITDAINKITE